MKFLVTFLVILTQCTHAQQYGWVRVAQLGNQFTSLNAVEFVDSLHGWTGSGSSAFFRTSDGGNTWAQSSFNAPVAITSVAMVGADVGWCVGAQGTTPGRIMKTTDGGANWFQQFAAANRNYLGTAVPALSKNITAGQTSNLFPDTGKVVQTTNGGTTWAEGTIADSIRSLGKVQFVDSLHGWIVAFLQTSAGILKTDDGGLTWIFYPTPFGSFGFTAISFIDTARGWGINAGGWVNRTTDGGMTWQPQFCICTSEDELIPRALSFVDSLKGWAFGTIFYQGDLAGAIYRTTDGGSSWQRDHVGLTRNLRDGVILDLTHGWAVGDAGVVLAYRNVTSVPERLPDVPRRLALHQNYPNPFNPKTTIEYEIVERSVVEIVVYDINGKGISLLVNSLYEPGVYRIGFDGSNLASGTYYCTMKTGTFSETRRMVLVK